MENTKWFAIQAQMFDEKAFHLGYAYMIYHIKEDGEQETFIGILYSIHREKLWFKITKTFDVQPGQCKCATYDLGIDYFDIENWDFSELHEKRVNTITV